MLVLGRWLASFMDQVKERIIPGVVIAFGALVAAVPCTAAPNVLAGKAYAQANCARCHSIDKFTPSSLAIAPPFRTLHERYPVESLEEALGEVLRLVIRACPSSNWTPGKSAISSVS